MADEEKEKPKDKDPDTDEIDDDERDEDEYYDDDPDEVVELRARVSELEAELANQLSDQKEEFSPAARWGAWIVGTLLGAICLALIVMVLGGGFSSECECPEPGEDQSQQQRDQLHQQVALERLVRDHSVDFQQCFDSWASSEESDIRPGWAILVRLEIEAGEGGRVEQAEASGENLPAPLKTCLERRVNQWVFPAPGPYTLELPFAVEGSGRPRDGGADGSPHSADGGPVDQSADAAARTEDGGA